MTELFQDVRYALRLLKKNRGFTAIAALTLALGIGVNTAIFSVVNGVLLSPLPFPNANRIVSLFQETPNFPKGSISYLNFLDWQRENRSFEAIAAYRQSNGSLTGVGEAEDVRAQSISATFFPVLGINPILGRNFTADEDRRGANPAVMISEGLWKRKFGSDPQINGKRIIVAGVGRTIVGVVPAWFQLRMQNFRTADIYAPIGEERDPQFHKRDSFWGMDAIGLLKPGVTLDQARDDMRRVNAGLAREYPDVNVDIKAKINTLQDEIVGEIRPVLLVLLGAVAFVLLIACVNVANLLLARSTGRRREFSIRAALGAGRARILRQLLIESTVLALMGGALGLLLAQWGTSAALAVVPSTLPRAEAIGLDLRVLLFTFFISVTTGIAFGLVPALKISHTGIGETLKNAGRTIAGHRSRAQAALVIGEMAMALVLLVGAGLMLRTLVRLWRVNPGFDARNVINFQITPPASLRDQSPEAIRAAIRQLGSTILSVPEVQSASLQWGARPMEGDNEVRIWPDGLQQPARVADAAQTLEYIVEPGYLTTMRIPLLRGRFLSDADNENSERIAVVDSQFVQKFFAGQDPVGKHVRLFDFYSDPTQRTWIDLVIVGVVGHVSQWGLADDAARPLQAQLYQPFLQASPLLLKNMTQGVGAFARSRSRTNTEAFFQSIRQSLSASSSDVIVSGNDAEEKIVSRSIANQRFSLTLLGIFAGLALLLASIGIYGVLSYLVGQRTQEIGVRMALGAARLDVLRMILRDGVRLTLVGVVIGTVVSLGLTRFLTSLLFEVNATDPATFAAVAVLLCAIALFACYLPARRAAKVDPMVALRYE
ncbi:MAG TPA: ABC transporter permease [Terriglobales bacterium]|nr:ABC transporter permease [Terriglobales bacterium]